MKEFDQYLSESLSVSDMKPLAPDWLKSTGKNGEGMYDHPDRAEAYFKKLATAVKEMAGYIKYVNAEFEAITPEDSDVLSNMEDYNCLQKMLAQLDDFDFNCAEKAEGLLKRRADDIGKNH